MLSTWSGKGWPWPQCLLDTSYTAITTTTRKYRGYHLCRRSRSDLQHKKPFRCAISIPNRPFLLSYLNIPSSDTRDTVMTEPRPHYLTADLLAAKRVQVDFLFPSPHQKLPTGVRHQRHTKGEDAGVMAFGQLPVVLKQQVAQCDLDLVGSKESSWAGVLSVSKSYLIRPGEEQES